MSRTARRLSAAAVLLAAGLFVAGSAQGAYAAPTPQASATASPTTADGPTGYACLDQKTGYEASGVCQLTVLKAQTVCRDNVPWLDYALDPQGTPNTTTTLVWGDENGTHVTMANLPLKGSVIWPGVKLDSHGTVVDWPGWTLQPDGTWTRGDDFSWVRPSVQVTFHVNPSATVTAYYPETNAPCANPPSTAVLSAGGDGGVKTAVLAADDPTPTLAQTGASDTGPLLAAGAGLVVLGGLVLTVRGLLRRRAATR